MIAVLNWSLNHWYVFFWLAVLGVFEGVRDFFLGIFQAIAEGGAMRHQRRMEEIRASAPVVTMPAEVTASRKPGPCVHRNVTPVIAADEDEPCAWLCRCGERLPANWAVREEDL
jgi:hypothetical protein